MYAEAVIIVAERPDNDAKRMQQAVLAVSYYQMLYDGCLLYTSFFLQYPFLLFFLKTITLSAFT